MQGKTPPQASTAGRSIALVLFALGAGIVAPAAAVAQSTGAFTCSAGPHDIHEVLDAHIAGRPAVMKQLQIAQREYREARRSLSEAQGDEVLVTMPERGAREARYATAESALQTATERFEAWAACRDELRRLRRYLPRSVHHVRVTLGSDGALFSMRNRDAATVAAGYTRVWYRTPGASLQVGWERFYLRRLGVQVSGTLAAGQGRFRACGSFETTGCYGHPPAGGALSVAVDVGLRVWVAPIVVLGLSAELRVTRLPITDRVQHGNRYSVSERVVPAALARLGPEVFLSADGRWWVSPTLGLGGMLTQRGAVFVGSIRVGYVL